MIRQCSYCLCKVCNKVRCPRGRYHCMPCYHGTILECDFFMHKRVTKTYRIVRRYKSISQKDLVLLRDCLNSMIGDDSVAEVTKKPWKVLLREEEIRHRKAIRDISVLASKKNI